MSSLLLPCVACQVARAFAQDAPTERADVTRV